ncbi:MAG: UPF0149 family protein [Betaproteobacteria bacterium]|nr:UPF0149 family protein [Betaproteobacteria bacterium]
MDYPRYDPASPITPLTTAELDALDALLQALPSDGAMTLDGLDGYLTALVVGPPAVLATWPTADWLPWVWGGDGETGPAGAVPPSSFPFASKRQRKTTVVMVLRHLRHLSQQLGASPATWEPIFSIAEQGGSEGAEERVDARDWCTGFLQAVDLQPEAWGDTWQDIALAPVLAPLLVLGGGLEGVTPAADANADLDDPTVCDRLSRAVPDAVLHLLARHAPQAGTASR